MPVDKDGVSSYWTIRRMVDNSNQLFSNGIKPYQGTPPGYSENCHVTHHYQAFPGVLANGIKAYQLFYKLFKVNCL